jgi:hypothetical protein
MEQDSGTATLPEAADLHTARLLFEMDAADIDKMHAFLGNVLRRVVERSANLAHAEAIATAFHTLGYHLMRAGDGFIEGQERSEPYGPTT